MGAKPTISVHLPARQPLRKARQNTLVTHPKGSQGKDPVVATAKSAQPSFPFRLPSISPFSIFAYFSETNVIFAHIELLICFKTVFAHPSKPSINLNLRSWQSRLLTAAHYTVSSEAGRLASQLLFSFRLLHS
jgi:hypothetical protein